MLSVRDVLSLTVWPLSTRWCGIDRFDVSSILWSHWHFLKFILGIIPGLGKSTSIGCGVTVAQYASRFLPSLPFIILIFYQEQDNYWITFGQVQNPRWKALLLALGIFMDFRLDPSCIFSSSN